MDYDIEMEDAAPAYQEEETATNDINDILPVEDAQVRNY